MDAKNGRDIVKIIAMVIAIPAMILAALAIGKIVIDRQHEGRRVHEMLEMVDVYQRSDDFGSALEELDKALVLRPDDRELQVRRVELETFQIATNYDQTHVLQDKQLLSGLQKRCARLLSEAGSARVVALCGIVEDLHDRPTGATKKYDQATHMDTKYPNAYNYWGYTVLKWNLGG